MTTPVLIAVLATVGGILVVGVGGGLVPPMQSRWENWLARAEEESRTIATHARAYRAGRRDVEARLSEGNPYAEAELTQPVARGAEADRTQPTTPRQPTVEQAADSEATMVLPPVDAEKFRR